MYVSVSVEPLFILTMSCFGQFSIAIKWTQLLRLMNQVVSISLWRFCFCDESFCWVCFIITNIQNDTGRTDRLAFVFTFNGFVDIDFPHRFYQPVIKFDWSVILCFAFLMVIIWFENQLEIARWDIQRVNGDQIDWRNVLALFWLIICISFRLLASLSISFWSKEQRQWQ